MNSRYRPLLEVKGLRTGYGRIPVVFGIDLEVGDGEIVALLGANGAGKTTTLRAISRVIPAFDGEINFDDRTITSTAAEKVARMGLLHVPEGRGIFPSLAVEETLRLAAAMAGVGKAESGERVAEAFDTFPRLAERATQTAGTLSGGEQQMLALARGLISRPKLLMIDEMSQGLAPTIVAGLFEIVAGFPERGTSVLLVEQFVGQALAIADRAYVLEKGEVSFRGSAAELAGDDEFVKGSYLGDVAVEKIHAAAGNGHAGGGDRPPADLLAEQISVRLPPALVRSLEERAEREGVPLPDLVRQAVEGTVAPAKAKKTASRRRSAR
jgi:branched-chain amino acid transport system ATP-binding protein